MWYTQTHETTLSLYAPSAKTNASRLKLVCVRQKPLCCVAARSCWPRLAANECLPLPWRSVATNKPFAMPSMHSTSKDWQQSLPIPVVSTSCEPLWSTRSTPKPLHRPPRDFGFQTSLWTLELLVKQCVRLGCMSLPVSIETTRQTLHRLGINGKRAKHWITSPDPWYQEKPPAQRSYK
jgi:hypothetical protein